MNNKGIHEIFPGVALNEVMEIKNIEGNSKVVIWPAVILLVVAGLSYHYLTKENTNVKSV